MSGIEFGDGERHVTDLSASFYSHFQAEKNDISTRLESLKTSSAGQNTNGDVVNSLSSYIVKLRKELVDATSYLPSYDRGKCEQQLKALEESLSKHRIPKSKFTFKRKTASASTPLPPTSPPANVPSQHAPSPGHTTNNLSLSSHKSKHLTLASLVLPTQDATLVRSSDLTLTDLDTCIVDFFTTQILPEELTLTAIHARSLRRVVLVIPPIEGSVLLHDVQDSLIVVGCHQFRMHDSRNTIVLLHSLSNPIIEGSTGIQFGGYPTALCDTFTHASQHMQAQDFDWIKPSPSPNWQVLVSSDITDKIVRLVKVGGVDANDVERYLDAIIPKG